MGTNTISLPVRFSRYDLSRLVNEALGLEKPIPFDFIVDGKLLRVSLSEYMSTHGISSESTVSLEYVPIISTPEEKSSTELPDWVSGIACRDNKYVAGCYDGTIHIYDMDDTLLAESSIHKRPIKSVDCTTFNNSFLVATASLDNTVHISSLDSTKIVPICTPLRSRQSRVRLSLLPRGESPRQLRVEREFARVGQRQFPEIGGNRAETTIRRVTGVRFSAELVGEPSGERRLGSPHSRVGPGERGHVCRLGRNRGDL